MTSIGVDIIEVERVESAIEQWGEHFLNRVYTEAELKTCQGRVPSLATRFAAKEAVMKVLGTGTRGASWKEIEILPDGLGKPVVRLYGKAKNKAEELNLREFSVSLSDTKQYAIAAAIGT